MSHAQRRLLMGLGALAGAALLWGGVHFGWYAPRAAALRQELAQATERVQNNQKVLDTNRRLQRQLADVVDRTLGENIEVVDHRLRTRLNRITEDLQLQQATVSTGRPAPRTNPSASSRFSRGQRELRNEIDFVELEGSISAEGTLAQAVALVDRIQAEPWIKRVTRVRLEPKHNGERFAVTVRLTTLFLPDRAPQQQPEMEYDTQRLEKFASLVQTNPFRMPAPPTATPPAPKSPPVTPQVEQWVVTGVAHGPDGAEAWLRNARSGESRRVGIGQQLRHAVLVAASGDQVEFEIDQQRLVVNVGGKLSVHVR